MNIERHENLNCLMQAGSRQCKIQNFPTKIIKQHKKYIKLWNVTWISNNT